MIEAFNFWKSAAGFAFVTFGTFAVFFFFLRMFTRERYGWPVWGTPAVVVGALVLWLLTYGHGWQLLAHFFGSDDVPLPLYDADLVSIADRAGFLKVEFFSAIAGLVAAVWAEMRFERGY